MILEITLSYVGRIWKKKTCSGWFGFHVWVQCEIVILEITPDSPAKKITSDFDINLLCKLIVCWRNPDQKCLRWRLPEGHPLLPTHSQCLFTTRTALEIYRILCLFCVKSQKCWRDNAMPLHHKDFPQKFTGFCVFFGIKSQQSKVLKRQCSASSPRTALEIYWILCVFLHQKLGGK